MISAPSNFTTANAALAKKPLHIFQTGRFPNCLAFSNSSSIPTVYPMLGLAGLVGAFTDGTGQVIQPVEVGALARLTVPSGATQLQLGINDDLYGGSLPNFGSFTVTVNGASVVVPGTTCPWNWVRGGLNTAFIYGFGAPAAGSGPGGSAPIVAATGLVAGDVIVIKYVSGSVSWGFVPTYGPEGDLSFITGTAGGTSNGGFPTKFMGTPVQDWLVSIEDLSVSISDLEGSSDLADLVVTAQDLGQAITAALAINVYEGQPARLLSGFVGLTFTDLVTLFTGQTNTIDSANGNNEYTFTASDRNLTKLSQKIYTVADDGFATDTNHIRTLNGNPLDILVSALNQCGIPNSEIDTAKIYFYRDSLFSGTQFVFELDTAPEAKDFIEKQLMVVLGMYLRSDNLGRLTISSFYPALSGSGSYTPPTYPQLTLDTDSTEQTVPVAQQSALVNQMAWRFDASGSDFNAEKVYTWAISADKYGLFGGNTIESKGLKSGFQGYFLAAFISNLIFLRYGLKQLLLDPVRAIWSQCILEPGDIIAVTNPFVPDRAAGVMGVTSKAFEVLDRTWKFQEGIVELKLLEIDLSKFKQFLITPNGEADFTADSPTNQAKYLYLSDANGLYSNGATANTIC